MNRPRRSRFLPLLLVLPLCADPVSARQSAGGGAVRGTVFDREYQVPLARAQVTVLETGKTVTAGDDGAFTIEGLPAGRYTLVFSKEGYLREVKPEVSVPERGTVDVDGTISGEFADMDEFIVQEVPIGGSERFLLKLRLESPSLMDSVGSELINRAGASDAAAALILVSGASVEDGKFAVIRGLPDRYVTALLNGVRIPTADEEKRAVQLDQFPSAVIQSVQVTKTFTPDQQGDSSGGSVNVVLKGIPEETSIQFKAQTGFNSQVVGEKNFVYDPNGIRAWGTDDGRRDIPYDLIGQNWPGPDGVNFGDAPGLDYKWSVSGGGKWDLDDGIRVGGFASFFYERDSSFFDNGIDDSLWVTTPGGGPMTPQTFQGTEEDGDFKTELLDITQSTQSVQWGGLGTFGIELENHEIRGTYLYTRNADDTATLAENTRGKEYYFPGYDPYDPSGPGNAPSELAASPYLRLETLDYIERETNTVILNGEHTLGFGDLGDPESIFGAPVFDWTVSLSSARFNEPDKTQFGAAWIPESLNPGFPPFVPPFETPAIWIPYKPDQNFTLGNMQRIWKTIDEDSTQWAFNVKLPFKQWSDSEGYFKTGYFNDQTKREYRQETFSNFNDNSDWQGDWSQYWSSVFPEQDHPVSDGPPFIDVNYDGEQRIDAYYLMAELPVVETFRLVGGVRWENTFLSIVNDPEEDATWLPFGAITPVRLNPGDADVDYSRNDVLPAIAFVWETTEWLTFRGSYAQTVARQTFRELSPIIQQEFLGGPIFIGNPNLQMSELQNYDLRLDLTPIPGGLISFSWFYKNITDPIETVQQVFPFTYTTVENYPDGTINGIEIDLRQDFGEIVPGLTGLNVGMNATFIDSEVGLPQAEIDRFASPAIDMPITSRAMSLTPEYLFNIYFTYDVAETGTQVGLFYSLTGDTLVAGAGVIEQPRPAFVPDIYALPIGTLNFTLQQELFVPGFKFFFQAKNLLNPEIETVYRSQYIPGDVLNTSYTAGVDFAFGLALQLDF